MSLNYKLLMVFISIGLGNFLYAATYSGDWDRFMELSFFETMPLIYLWSFDKIFCSGGKERS